MKRICTVHIDHLLIGYADKNSVQTVAGPLDADLNSGELTCLLGINGVGKTTLLRTLSASLKKLGGSIEILDKNIDDYSSRELSTVISVVLTEKCIINNLTVRELVALGRSPYTDFWGTLETKDKEMVDRSLQQIQITHLSDKNLQTLSDGERQKAMIAKALAQETPVIFLDEPTAFLDYPSKVEMMQLLHRLSREMNKTIFISTHDLELALQLADKLWIMDKKEGIRIGTPEDLSLDGSLKRFFDYPGIAFDWKSGLFRINNPIHRNVCLSGDGKSYVMAQKALSRNGIKTNRDIKIDEKEINIEAFNGEEGSVKYIVHTSSNPSGIEVNNVESLLNICVEGQ